VVSNLLKMLSRLIGEHIRLEWIERHGVPDIEADPGMIKQVVLNLVVNARDAYSAETASQSIDPEVGILYLPKPYSMALSAKAVRACLVQRGSSK
jgi:nitrogen fixation/metabolism regulation signal transduction histidine kinase